MDNITSPRAETIRSRFLAIANTTRLAADAAAAKGDMVSAQALRTLAASQERMAHKRYESMTIRAL